MTSAHAASPPFGGAGVPNIGAGPVTLARIANATDAMTVRDLRATRRGQVHFRHPLARRFIELPADPRRHARRAVALNARAGHDDPWTLAVGAVVLGRRIVLR